MAQTGFELVSSNFCFLNVEVTSVSHYVNSKSFRPPHIIQRTLAIIFSC